MRNSIAAQEFGADLTDEYRSRGFTLGIDAGDQLGARWSLTLDRDRQSPLAVHAKPVSGSFQPAFAADSVTEWRAAVQAFHARSDAPFGCDAASWADRCPPRDLTSTAAARGGLSTWTGRISVEAAIERPFGEDRLVLSTTAATVLGTARRHRISCTSVGR